MPRETTTRHDRFERLYTENLPLILGYAARRCAQPSDAGDIAAEVFLTAWRRIDDLPQGQERMWLFGAARKVLANYRRGLGRRTALADRLRTDLAAGVVLASEHGTLDVTAALASLPDRDRELLTLAVWDGLTPSEIAQLEQIPAATVRSRLLRARARLRAALDDGAGARAGVGAHTATGHLPGPARP